LDDKRTYLLVPPHPDATSLRIHLVEFDLTPTKLAGWHEAGRRVAAEVELKILGSDPPPRPAESRTQAT
jgi:hypothetical protein